MVFGQVVQLRIAHHLGLLGGWAETIMSAVESRLAVSGPTPNFLNNFCGVIRGNE